MVLKNKYLQILCLFLIGYSILGGLLLPLSPNIEQVVYSTQDSVLEFKLYVPKIKSQNNELFLVKNQLKNATTIAIKPIETKRIGDTIIARFISPNYFKNIKKGDNFDLICSNASDGNMYYFSAYFVDTVIGNRDIASVALPVYDKDTFKWSFPNRNILKESIRNLFFHVPMWFTMIALLVYSLIHSLKYLSKEKKEDDIKAAYAAYMALFFGIIGILTGMIWAKHTWGAYWTNDPKLNGAAIGMLVYFAYYILRSSIPDTIKRARLSAVYNIFAFTIYIIFIMIMPRIYNSLHPGNGGNPGFNIYEQDDTMRLFFYPAVLGWILLGLWLKDIYVSIHNSKK